MHARASGCTGVVGMLPLTTHPLFALLRMHRLAPRNDAAADSAVETLSPCVPGRRQCFSVPVRNVLSGQDGGYGGRVIGRVGPRNSPDGTAWTWQQCAAMCLNYDGYRASNGLADGETCVYFLLSVQKGCVMKANQEKFTANTGRNTVIGNGVCTRSAPRHVCMRMGTTRTRLCGQEAHAVRMGAMRMRLCFAARARQRGRARGQEQGTTSLLTCLHGNSFATSPGRAPTS